jgi:hypothetical protein
MEWLFSGLGTAMISFFLGIISGGVIGYRIAIKNNKQRQKAGDNSQQIQIGRDYHGR